MTESYYDNLAPYYQYLYPNWENSVQRQAKQLDDIIRKTIGEGTHSLLDAACGIGTQSIGLARLGYKITASDLSSGEIAQARLLVEQENLPIDFHVADMRQVWQIFQKQFDVVIACDNAVPHLLNDDEILMALRQFYQCTRPGGCCLISVRDYARLEHQDGAQFYPRLIHKTALGQIVLFDLWNFSGDQYEITTYLIEDEGLPNPQSNILRGGRYYCVQISSLENLFVQAGFEEVTILRDRFFQPLLLGKKPS